jgi:septum formation topological specificity factor MinE
MLSSKMDIFSPLPKKIDFLLEAEKDTNFTTLSWLRDDIGKSSTNTILEVIKKIDRIDNLKLKLNLNSIPSYKIEQFIRLGRRYEPFSLRRFEDKKRYTIMSIYLINLKQSLVDKAIVLHDLKVVSIFKKIKKNQFELVKKQRKVIKEVITDYFTYGETIIEANENQKDVGRTIEDEISWEKFKESVATAKVFSIKTKQNPIDMLDRYYIEFKKICTNSFKKIIL